MIHKHEHYFSTPVYFLEKKEWVENLNIYCDKYIKEAIEHNKKINKNNNGFENVNHSSPLTNDNNFIEFSKFICKNALQILNDQGYDSSLYAMMISELWVQEFPKNGGGHHIPHVHSNSHISGFYFLKCSNKTSYPVFHDPRPGKVMIQLPEKESHKINLSSEKINLKIKPGLFIFFNSYLPHEYVVDEGKEPFRFIHFNIQAFPKNLFK